MTNYRLPASVKKYAETPVFSETTVPAKLLGLHNTKAGVWGRIIVLAGELEYIIPGPPEQRFILTPDTPGIIRPTEEHSVTPIGSVKFKVEFLAED